MVLAFDSEKRLSCNSFKVFLIYLNYFSNTFYFRFQIPNRTQLHVLLETPCSSFNSYFKPFY